MIARHGPALTLAKTIELSGRPHVSTHDLEREFAQVLEVNHAVLTPSARAGIDWAIQALAGPSATIICPAYTCPAVYEAVCRPDRDVIFMDSGGDDFSMAPSTLVAAQQQHRAVAVLCELYGHPYDLPVAAVKGNISNGRIFDTAMGLPSVQSMKRLGSHDVAIISFGIGKCMYAGTGGMAFTNNAEIADAIRHSRTNSMQEVSALRRLGMVSKLFLRTLAHQKVLYGLARRAANMRQDKSQPVLQSRSFPRPNLRHWRAMPSVTGTKLMHSFAVDLAYFASRKLELSERYAQRLANIDEVLLPPSEGAVLSHYSIRLPSSQIRNELRKALWMHGVDTGVLFQIQAFHDATRYPHAVRLSETVLNLPLNLDLVVEDVDRISHIIGNFFRRPPFSADKNRQGQSIRTSAAA